MQFEKAKWVAIIVQTINKHIDKQRQKCATTLPEMTSPSTVQNERTDFLTEGQPSSKFTIYEPAALADVNAASGGLPNARSSLSGKSIVIQPLRHLQQWAEFQTKGKLGTPDTSIAYEAFRGADDAQALFRNALSRELPLC